MDFINLGDGSKVQFLSQGRRLSFSQGDFPNDADVRYANHYGHLPGYPAYAVKHDEVLIGVPSQNCASLRGEALVCLVGGQLQDIQKVTQNGTVDWYAVPHSALPEDLQKAIKMGEHENKLAKEARSKTLANEANAQTIATAQMEISRLTAGWNTIASGETPFDATLKSYNTYLTNKSRIAYAAKTDVDIDHEFVFKMLGDLSKKTASSDPCEEVGNKFRLSNAMFKYVDSCFTEDEKRQPMLKAGVSANIVAAVTGMANKITAEASEGFSALTDKQKIDLFTVSDPETARRSARYLQTSMTLTTSPDEDNPVSVWARMIRSHADGPQVNSYVINHALNQFNPRKLKPVVADKLGLSG